MTVEWTGYRVPTNERRTSIEEAAKGMVVEFFRDVIGRTSG